MVILKIQFFSEFIFQRYILSLAERGRPGGLGDGHARQAGQVGAGHALLEGLGLARLRGEVGHALHGRLVYISVIKS